MSAQACHYPILWRQMSACLRRRGARSIMRLPRVSPRSPSAVVLPPSLCFLVFLTRDPGYTRPAAPVLRRFVVVSNAATTAPPSPDEEVYLCLLRVYLQSQQEAGHPAPKTTGSPPPPPSASDGGEQGEVGGVDEAISLLERHFARVDPVQVMALLPPDVPVSKLVPFLSSAVRHAETKRRNNQVGTYIACVRVLFLCALQKKTDEGI